MPQRGSTDYASTYTGVDFRKEPERYRIGRGEQGVLIAEPYKSEILPFWRFRTPGMARESADAIYRLFVKYRDQSDFVGMDMARKFLQMGWTRSRRYANHVCGLKFDPASGEELKRVEDPQKAESAAIFRNAYDRARNDPVYVQAKADWQNIDCNRS